MGDMAMGTGKRDSNSMEDKAKETATRKETGEDKNPSTTN